MLPEVPMKSILDPSFRYTSSVETDLRKTFARMRRELRRRDEDRPAPTAVTKYDERRVQSPACVPEP
jgi:hypothetical protein